MTIIIRLGILGLNIIFAVMKCLPVKNKITYISRQMDTTPLDFQMLIEQMQKADPTIQHVVLAKMLKKGMKNHIQYCFHMFVQMYHIATSHMVILDTYCIPVSILKQRQSLIVIQIWHALGAFKKFGYSILDQEEGSSSKVAHLMKMHKNYTYVFSSSEYTKPYFAEAFHVSLAQVQVFPLPKTDLLIDADKKQAIVEHIYQCYPQLKKHQKKVIVYAPTFRKEDQQLQQAIQDLIECIDFEHYDLVLKLHPLTEFQIHDSRIITDNQLTSLEFFHVADFIVTDYSAVIFEASLLEKPLFFYAFDYDNYMEKRDMYIDYQKDLPGQIFKDPQELFWHIQHDQADLKRIQQFAARMIASPQKTYTLDIVEFILKQWK